MRDAKWQQHSRPFDQAHHLERGRYHYLNTNELNLNLTTDFTPGNYKGDIRFRLDSTQNWITLIAMDVVITASISRKDV